jgi:replicative DNA helicase
VPDLIIIDYLDLMKPHRTYGDVHAEIDAITKGIVGFAAEFDTAIYTATQLNRAGLVADTPDEAGMAGYIGKQYHADMVMWMAQTREEREDELMRILMSKNRNGKMGTITLETNFSYMTFYRESEVTETKEVLVDTPAVSLEDALLSSITS